MHGKPDLPTNAPILEIQPEPSLLQLCGFSFHIIQFIEAEDGPEYVPMPFDPYGNVTIANMIKIMNYCSGLGHGKR